MILDEKIKIKISKPNVRFYKDKYNCKVGDYIYIEVDDISKGSGPLINVKCDVCGHEKKLGYNKYIKNIKNCGYYSCSSKCAIMKKKKTWIKNIGTDNPMKSEKVKAKMKKTCLLKYGFDNPMKNKTIQKKVNITCINKYNHPYYLNSKSFKNKMIELYGFDNPMKSPIINNNRIKTSFRINEFENIKYQGSYELDFLKLCKEYSIVPIRPDFFIKYNHENKNKNYLPDYYLPDLNLIIEIKSTYFYNLYKEANDLKKEYTINSGYNYLMILDKNYIIFKNTCVK